MDMTKLLGSQIGLDDFIFVHRKGNLKIDHFTDQLVYDVTLLHSIII